ncbi:MAG: SCP2 sterol-binding domain-containing protein [Actinomycetota bacterium]|nr:SCP2 sterol-binding domain-containing protein [Actinomycetota bacterium]
MVAWLSQEWLDETRRLTASHPPVPGASATIQYVVSGGPGGDVEYYWVLTDGRLEAAALGRLDAPELTMSQSREDAMEIQKGALDPSAAYMQGRLKVSGDMAKLMSLLPLTSSKQYRQLTEQVAACTDFVDAESHRGDSAT